MPLTRRLFVTLSIVVFPALSSCGTGPTGPSHEPAEDVVLYGVHQNLTVDGQLLARIQADSLYHRKGSPAMLIWAPAIDFSPTYPENPPLLSGDQVVVNHAQRKLTLRGRAVFEIPGQGVRITGEELRFRYSEGWLVADSPSVAYPKQSTEGS